MVDTPRGIRNNNPGNIDWSSANNWVGQLGRETGVTNPRFVRFDTIENGIRALSKNLLTYFGRGLDTVREIISTWAPPNENNTSAYVNAVARELGVSPDQSLNLRDANTLEGLTTAIIKHENGGFFGITTAQIRDGVNRALGNSGTNFPAKSDTPDIIRCSVCGTGYARIG